MIWNGYGKLSDEQRPAIAELMQHSTDSAERSQAV